MADIRIKDLPTTASLTSSDDFIAIDGFTNGTRKLSAATPAFLTSVTTPSLTSPASTDLTLAAGGTNQNVVLTPSGTGGVGIGTVSPINKLDVFGTAVDPSLTSHNGIATIRGSSSYGIEFGEFAANAMWIQAHDVSNSGLTQTISINPLGGRVNFGDTTAGAANAGALVVQGGISAGNTGAASYFGGAVAVSAGGLSGLIVGSNLANNGATIQLLGRSSGFNNWMLATSFYAANGNIGLVPSTTVGGSTFSTPVFELTPTGAATFAGAVTAPAAGYSINASGTYGMSLLQIDNSLDRLGLTAGASVSGATFTARYAAPMVVRMAPDVGVFQICVDSGKTIGNAYTPTGQLEISSTSSTFSGTVIVPAATASLAPLRIPHGTAPTSPTNGDMWTTTAGLYIRINGATVGPLS